MYVFVDLCVDLFPGQCCFFIWTLVLVMGLVLVISCLGGIGPSLLPRSRLPIHM